MNKHKILMTASVWPHIRNFHLPYLEAFQKLGWETHVGCAGIPAEAQHVDNTSKLFGEMTDFIGLPSYPKCAVDLTPSNVLVSEDGKPTMIDYEWWVDQPVPVELIKYHAIYTSWQFHQEIRHSNVSLKDVLEKNSIDETSRTRCDRALHHFYTHIGGSKTLDILLCDDGYNSVQFLVWNDDDGQDESIWWEAHLNKSGYWECKVDLSRFYSKGFFVIDAYAQLDYDIFLVSRSFSYVFSDWNG